MNTQRDIHKRYNCGSVYFQPCINSSHQLQMSSFEVISNLMLFKGAVCRFGEGNKNEWF